MKFAIAVVMLALAVGVHSSYIGHYAPAVSYVTSAVHPAGPWGGHWGGGHWGPAAVAVHHDATAWGHSGPSHWDNSGPAAHWGGGYPGISLSQGPHGAHIAAPLAAHGHGHDGVYVAKTRGAVHTAPLAGHINSATSLNLAAAPGTH